ncbi:Leucyl aminopeptidase yscIV [Cadophora gregata]|uniref:Leucyl aminopeptidase yscIV n=1 Tax=Cadophora gregata TaxID=51156 RepID=UPI0026DDBCC6|nr:Leucyl aminopeptidase yscIV [Cadophora gregata]KAK0099408.1 Leucyl aminopeptidase yscIV [Cadophora gregata f. sp. sojae]KAK0106799.1 Leucyl aminopeptidase yscIV [Cadophora gregata]
MKFQLLAASLAAVSSVVSAEEALEPRALPLVQSNQLRRVLLRSELLAKARTLEGFAYATPQRNRQIFTPGHKATYEWLYESIKKLSDYYTVEYHEFLTESATATVTVDGVNLVAEPLTFTSSGKPTGVVVAVPNLGCDAADYAGLDLTGKIALISRGTCNFSVKTLFAGSAGAVGTIVYNNADSALGGTLGGENPAFVPTVMISRVDGLALVASSQSSTKTASLDVLVTELPTYNVIAQTKGGDQNNVLLAGAHSDSVKAGPGINDNGSGTIALLEIAQQLTKFSTKNAVRFAWWSAEEVGLVGSTKYVESLSAEELAKITLYLNFDMLASPNYVYAIYDGDGSAFNISGPPGSAAAEKLFEDYFTNDAGLNHVPTAFNSRSDYAAFAAAGVPVGGLFTGAEVLKTEREQQLFGGQAGVAYDVNYHAAGDNAKNVNVGAWIQNSKAIAHAVATYGVSFESLGIGKREERVAKRSMWKQEVPREEDHESHHVGGGCSHSVELA